jgi:hypothetical protein
LNELKAGELFGGFGITVTIRLSMMETGEVLRKVQYAVDNSGTLVAVIVF